MAGFFYITRHFSHKMTIVNGWEDGLIFKNDIYKLCLFIINLKGLKNKHIYLYEKMGKNERRKCMNKRKNER